MLLKVRPMWDTLPPFPFWNEGYTSATQSYWKTALSSQLCWGCLTKDNYPPARASLPPVTGQRAVPELAILGLCCNCVTTRLLL